MLLIQKMIEYLKRGIDMYGMIATWRMALEGIEKGNEILKEHGSCLDALEDAVKDVEDFEYYKSVGYGGLPNKEGVVELDASFMDGDTLEFGAVGAVKDYANPVSIARSLMKYDVNNFLVGKGAEQYAKEHGFERKNMLTERAQIHYANRLKEMEEEIKPYSGHDTVGMIALDEEGHMGSATSTSGLFMKHPGRLGDSPVCGSGFYVDSNVGGASATGLGEDVMKGCISYEIVRLMKEGMHPQKACEKAVFEFDEELKRRRGKAGDMSLIAMNNKGEWGCATNIEGFSFVVATETLKPTVYLVKKDENHKLYFEEASKEWMDDYMKTRTAPLVRK